jgi:hypothetical protein
MRIRKEKPIFRGLTIAAAGDLGGSAQWTDANIARWVGLREGKFVRAMGEDVTHVVCSGEEFRRREDFGTFFPSHSLSLTRRCDIC